MRALSSGQAGEWPGARTTGQCPQLQAPGFSPPPRSGEAWLPLTPALRWLHFTPQDLPSEECRTPPLAKSQLLQALDFELPAVSPRRGASPECSRVGSSGETEAKAAAASPTPPRRGPEPDPPLALSPTAVQGPVRGRGWLRSLQGWARLGWSRLVRGLLPGWPPSRLATPCPQPSRH